MNDTNETQDQAAQEPAGAQGQAQATGAQPQGPAAQEQPKAAPEAQDPAAAAQQEPAGGATASTQAPEHPQQPGTTPPTLDGGTPPLQAADAPANPTPEPQGDAPPIADPHLANEILQHPVATSPMLNPGSSNPEAIKQHQSYLGRWISDIEGYMLTAEHRALADADKLAITLHLNALRLAWHAAGTRIDSLVAKL